MRRTRHNKEICFTGLFILAAFVSLYLAQLVCNLPHLVQRLQPVVATPAHQHSAGHHEHSRPHEGGTSRTHHGNEHAHHEDEHPAPSSKDAGCCAGQSYAPFVKASTSVELLSLAKAPFTFIGDLLQAMLGLLYKNRVIAVSHAPPDAPVPKIPDIRIFLHSLII